MNKTREETLDIAQDHARSAVELLMEPFSAPSLYSHMDVITAAEVDRRAKTDFDIAQIKQALVLMAAAIRGIAEGMS